MKPQLLAIVGAVLVLLIIGSVALYFTMFRKTQPVEDPAVVAARLDTDGDGVPDIVEKNQGTAFDDRNRYPAHEGRAASHKKVIVARTDVATNTLLKEADFQVREVAARGEAPDAAFAEGELIKAVGRICAVEIHEGDFLTEAMLFGGRPQLSYLVPKYKRAISLRYDQLASVSGLLRMGDVVDVIGHFRVRRREDGEMEYSRTLVQNARIIALGQMFLPEERLPTDTSPSQLPSGRVIPTTTPVPLSFTVLVYPHEAEQLIWAENYPGARLILALRSPVNDALARTSGVTDEALFGTTLLNKPQVVEVYSGGARSGVMRFRPRDGDRLGLGQISDGSVR